MLQKNQIVELSIRSISSEGLGVGTAEGVAVFVPGTAVGDRLLARIVRPKARFAYGIVEQLLAPSQDRCSPNCSAYPRCGGCQLRHLSYEAQLRAKREIVAQALQRIGGLNPEVAETLESPLAERYRNKVQFPVTEQDGNLVAGLYARRTHDLVVPQDCLLQSAEMNRAAETACRILQLQGVSAYDETSHSGLLRHLFLRRSGESGKLMLCLVLNGSSLPDEAGFVKQMLAVHPNFETIVLNENRMPGNVILGERCRALFGDGYLHDQICGVPVRLSPLSFFQVNTPAAERLYTLAAELADCSPQDTLLDLYCGAGTIGLSIAKRSPLARLIGVEVVPQAVEDARRNAEGMGLAHRCSFLAADAGQAAAQFAAEGTHVDIAVLDPPRKGCSEQTLQALLQMQPRRIVMISCNPATLARDLAFLCRNGYAAHTVHPVDLFPHTAHVEAVVLLTRC